MSESVRSTRARTQVNSFTYAAALFLYFFINLSIHLFRTLVCPQIRTSIFSNPHSTVPLSIASHSSPDSHPADKECVMTISLNHQAKLKMLNLNKELANAKKFGAQKLATVRSGQCWVRVWGFVWGKAGGARVVCVWTCGLHCGFVSVGWSGQRCVFSLAQFLTLTLTPGFAGGSR